ncbi:carboxymuconolactone decarboxylase family protein [Fibrella arboris]|uniref:carboxymuconolactone decarboxylase family protein n=1 Tax=Fibrella arboris TaxID=3242486 RepID=UPI0035228E43
MATFTVLIREQISASNQQLFDVLTQKLGMVPNLYAIFVHSDNALSNYLTFQQEQAKGAFNARLREAIYITVSQVNGCAYCLAAHTVLGKMNGFSDEQLFGIRASCRPIIKAQRTLF